VVFLAAIDRDGVPPGRRVPGHNLGRNQFEDRPFTIIQGVPQPIHFMLDVTKRRVGGAQLAIVDPERGILLLEFVQRFQSGTNGRNLFLHTRAGGKKRCQKLINARLKFARRVCAETQKVTENRSENQQRDDAGPAHCDCGAWNAECGLRNIDIRADS